MFVQTISLTHSSLKLVSSHSAFYCPTRHSKQDLVGRQEAAWEIYHAQRIQSKNFPFFKKLLNVLSTF